MKRIELEEVPLHEALGTEQPDRMECFAPAPPGLLHAANQDYVNRRRGVGILRDHHVEPALRRTSRNRDRQLKRDSRDAGDRLIDPQSCAVRIRHPLECRPFRPQPRPAWSPGTRDRRDAGRPRVSEAPIRRNPHLRADQALGAVRINFRYASFQAMMAAHSEKAGRDQYFEGPHETFGFRLHEIEPLYVDLQYQPIKLKWLSLAGVAHEMTFDYGVETQEGRVILGEDKASKDYFDDPDLNERLDFAEAFLEKCGVSLERRVAGGLPTALARRCVKDIFDARRTRFDDATAARVREVLKQSGGTTSLGSILTVIGGHAVAALEIARALMHKRILSMPASTPTMSDTPVTMPPTASKWALRAFLAEHIPS